MTDLTCRWLAENPHDVADKFLIDEGLPAAYRSQVVDFILRNTGNAPPTFDSAYVDPYTGGMCCSLARLPECVVDM